MSAQEYFCTNDKLSDIRRERDKRGIVRKYDSTAPVAHPMLNKVVLDNESQKTYLVQKAVKHWSWGYFYALLLVDCNESHRLVYWENISCADELTLSLMRKDKFILL